MPFSLAASLDPFSYTLRSLLHIVLFYINRSKVSTLRLFFIYITQTFTSFFRRIVRAGAGGEVLLDVPQRACPYPGRLAVMAEV